MQSFFEKPKDVSTSFPKKYSIDLMWINRTLDERQPLIPDIFSKDVSLDLALEGAIEWKKENPEADVSIWYDSKTVTPEALAAANELLAQKIAKAPLYSIKLRDIRELDLVAKNPDVFSDFIPVYFRVDLLKLIIILNAIESEEKQAAVFADIAVGDGRAQEGKTLRMGKKELFSNTIMDRLKELGIQVNLAENIRYENQFFQIINKPETIDALKIYINANLARAITALNLYAADKDEYSHVLPGLCTAVFSTMLYQLFPLILGLINQTLVVNGEAPDTKIPYQPAIHGHIPLGNFFLSRNPYGALIIDGIDVSNSIPSSQKLNIIELISEVDNHQFGRNDLDTRGGNHKYDNLKNLVERPPADGSDTYKYVPLEIDVAQKNEHSVKQSI